MQKKIRKKGVQESIAAEKTRARRNARNPQSYHFKRILRKKTNEESRLKGENKVECKKWSAKGSYRKASAEREPTQDLNTLGGQRPRADPRGSMTPPTGQHDNSAIVI